MDLTTKYMGLTLRTPIVPSACQPLSEDVDNIKRMEDAGASAVVLYSLFEEQLRLEQRELDYHMTAGTESFAESLTYFPEASEYSLGPEEYLKHIQKAKAACKIPIIASLNGTTVGGWTKFASQMQQAGADALELNIYSIPAHMGMSGEEIEKQYIEVVKAVKGAVSIPVAVKLSPFFSSMANMAKKLVDAGADGLTLFNRFYQPDIDLEELAVKPNVILSAPQALRLPLRWIAILYGRVNTSLAGTSGIHTAEDVAKMVLVGADVTMVCATLLRNGIKHLTTLEQGLVKWMTEKEYDKVSDMRGAVSQVKCGDPTAYERAQYMRAVTSYHPEANTL